MRSPLLVLLLVLPAVGAAQLVPPVPKGVAGDTKLQRPGPIPLPAPNQKWIRVRTPRFTIISSADDRRTREVGERLEALAASLSQVNERFDGRSIDTRALLFNRRRDSQPIFDLLLAGRNANGVFVGHPDGSGTMIIDAGMELDRTVYHELVHNLLSGSGAHLPLWLEEGIAEYFSTAEFTKYNVVIGRSIAQHNRMLWSRSPIPLAVVVAARRDSQLVTHPMFYPEAWATVDYLMRANRGKFYELLTDVDAGMSSAAAIIKHYHIDVTTIERTIRKPRPLPAAIIKVPLRAVEGSVSIGSITRSEALFEIGSFLGLMETSAPDAERFFNAALELEPEHGRAITGLANLRTRQKDYDDAFPLYERALKASPDDPVVLLDFGEALMMNMVGSFAGLLPAGPDARVKARRARGLADRALQHDGDAARANAIIGSSYLVEDDVIPGIPPLQRALELRPARSDIAINLYAMYLRSGDRARADALFEKRFARARNPQVTLAARTIFVQEQLTIANQYIAGNELDKAEALVKELAALTTDPVAKLDLENQLRRLRETSLANAQIVAYNLAIRVANKGENEKAKQMVDELLKTATDAKVIEDAKQLRAMLEWRIRRARP